MKQVYDLYNPKDEFIVSGEEMNLILTQERTEAYLEGLRASQNKCNNKDIVKMKAMQTEFNNQMAYQCGSFYFNFYNRFKAIERQYLFRFIYICTYMNYDNLLSDGRKLIRGNDIYEIMLLSRTESYRTKKYLIDNEYIFVNDDETISVNPKYCKKGEITKRSNIEVVRMFNDAIRELYEKSSPKEHKKLALLIELLPYINLKHNIVCKNPSEELIGEVEPLKMKELCEIVGYDVTNSTKLKKDLFSLRVSGEMVIGIFEKDNGRAIYVNPKVYYKGTCLEDLIGLANMFRV